MGHANWETMMNGAGTTTGSRSKSLILAAMIFAVAMTFIDQTIVSIAAPKIQADLGLSSSGMQWGINAYLLALAALFAFGGRLADTAGHRRMVTLGVVIFAGASALCGLTPRGGFAEAWLVTFRAVQGAGGAIMFPAALAIVVATFDLHSRGRALALFFGIAGGLTAIGPITGGYLLDWTWRAIFWINVPIALIALVLIVISRPASERRPAPMDYRGLALIVAGVALSVFGLQQSSVWGWGDPATEACITAGAVLLAVFVAVERRTRSPLINIGIFGNQAFAVENLILGIAMMVFIPVFFFVSMYGQIALGEKPTTASLLILYFFLGYVVCAQIGGRMLDRAGARRPVLLGSVLAAIGFALWAGKATDLHAGAQVTYIVMAGAGLGFMLGQANTDAVNQASRYSYGEATGITQTVRNYGASLGFAILGTILLSRFRSAITASLTARGLSGPAAAAQAAKIAQLQGGSGGTAAIPAFIRADFADATHDVLYAMAAIMAVAAFVTLRGLSRGVQAESPQDRQTGRAPRARAHHSAFRFAVLAVLAVAVAGVLTACGSPAARQPDPSPSVSATCQSASLAIAVDDSQASGGAGSFYYPLDFTNTSATACQLYGYPGVSFVTAGDGTGQQIGLAALRSPAAAKVAVPLAPGGTAHAWLQVIATLDYPASSCQPVTAHWLRIYPPGDTMASYLAYTFSACSSGKTPVLTVLPVRGGRGTANVTP